MFNKDRLRIAKELRGLSNPEFAEKLGCSTSKVKQLLDVEREISENDQAIICKTLNLPLSFFTTEDTPKLLETDQVFYRSVARIKAQYRKSNEAYMLLAVEINKYLTKKFKLPVFHRPDLDVTESLGESHYAERMASELRSLWSLGNQPINNILSLCELKGIRVFRLPLEVKEIDALSFFDDESGSPFMFINNFKSAERTRFDCAHELGHVVMHTHNKHIRDEKDNRILETEADQFASEFLMPTDGFRATAPRYLSLDSMIKYKKTWRTSLKAINYKAHKLGYISDWVNRSNSMKINSLGYNINEPEETHRDESVMLPKIIGLLATQPDFDKQKMLNEIGISEYDFNELTFDSLTKLDVQKKKPKLRIVE
ncbi:XRE family transcriptional regulator [Acinetobacter brisouii]|uniref:XRE family transcriptional regulator n=1 Tax=Acinetobacter brisouii TaxID=396323 RepID=UPI00124F18B0|nr:XRE family transcriptional regulator [Acinetobacter brisouii]